jgi:8-oxo-dGTP pyrophosphatase MutT (NUDIX family)
MGDSAPPLRIRPAARAVLRTPDDHVLLVRFEFPGGTRWALPGGGIDPGETALEALRRELVEEVGLTDAAIGPHIWNRLHIIPFLSGEWDGQHETVHLVDVEAVFTPRPALSWEQLASEYLHELRWWHLDEIAAAVDTVFVPRALAALLRSLRTEGPPNPPVDVDP